ncbi:MAG: hypothetical protein R3C26_09170 [Calditrichia bacterium]
MLICRKMSGKCPLAVNLNASESNPSARFPLRIWYTAAANWASAQYAESRFAGQMLRLKTAEE